MSGWSLTSIIVHSPHWCAAQYQIHLLFPLEPPRALSYVGHTHFSLFVNNLPQTITGATRLLFANDTTIYAIGKDMASIAESLTFRSVLHLASEWLCDNHLSLNMMKTKTMHAHSLITESKSASSICPPPLAPVEQVYTTKFLGVYINDTLTWCEHVGHVSSSISRNLNLLRWLLWFLPKSTLLVIYHSYILPSLTIVMWCGAVV